MDLDAPTPSTTSATMQLHQAIITCKRVFTEGCQAQATETRKLDAHRDSCPGMTHRCRRVWFRQADIPVRPARENAWSGDAKRYSGSGDELLAGSAQFAYFPVSHAWVFFVWARRQESLPVSMMLPPKVRRSTIAAQSRGSVRVFVQPENDEAAFESNPQRVPHEAGRTSSTRHRSTGGA